MSLLQGLARRTRRLLNLPREHVVGGVSLALPAEHRLPEYQAAYPRYDRFLTRLAAQLAPQDAVVDVGANVGDTLAALLAGQPALQLLALEADAGFFRWLQRNATRLRLAYPRASIVTQQVLVGNGSGARVLVGRDGTRRAVPGSGAAGVLPRPLDALLREQPRSFGQRLRLVKSDVDGGDHEVIASALPVLAECLPLVYFECMVEDAVGRDAHLATVQALFDAGYAELHLFDNFGQPLESATDLAPLVRRLDELLEGHAAMHYVDLLACSAADAALARRAVSAHVSGTAD